MGKFLEVEKPRQAEFKRKSGHFSNGALADGVYKGHLYPHCIPHSCAEENLFHEIRDSARSFFAAHGIKWHDGQDGNPSNHMCDSQVCCVNFLYQFADKPGSLIELLRPLFPTISKVLPLEGQFVSFEWIGAKNYLKEKERGDRPRTRGANFTSADAAVMFEHTNGLKQFVLIEWKYTETYFSTPLQYSRSVAKTDRTQIYMHLYEQEDCTINKSLLPNFVDLFYEPLYQLMRQQFLADQMERHHELGADIVSVLHIAPRRNTEFRRITSPALADLNYGDSVTEVWHKLLNKPDRFMSVYTEDMFGQLPIDRLSDLTDWWTYISQRYVWMGS